MTNLIMEQCVIPSLMDTALEMQHPSKPGFMQQIMPIPCMVAHPTPVYATETKRRKH